MRVTTRSRHATTLFVAALCLCPSSLASAQDASAPSQAAAAAVRGVAVTTEPSAQALDELAYVLQRGDTITVKVFNVPELEDTVQIRPDGRVSLLLVDDVKAAGMTPGQLDGVLTDLYSRFVRDPQVSVIVRSFVNLKVYVGGEVAAPGLVPLEGELTVVGAVFRAGGLRETAHADNVILLRNSGQNTPLVMQVNLEDVLKKGRPDVVLRPFDVVYVPKSKIAKVNQFVNQYIRQMLPISLVAGFTYVKGDTSAITITP